MSRGSVVKKSRLKLLLYFFNKNLRARVQLVRMAQFSSSRPRSRLRSAAGVLAACSQEANANCQFAAQQFPLTDSPPRARSGDGDCHSEGPLRQNGPQQHCTPAWKCIRIARNIHLYLAH